MVIPTAFFDGAKWAAIGGFALCVFFGGALIPKNVDRDSPRGKKIRTWILSVLAVLVVLGIAGFAIDPFATPVVLIVATDGASPTIAKRDLFGTSSYVFRDGHSETLAHVDGTEIVNDTTIGMHVETTSYGDANMATLVKITSTPEEAPASKITSVHHPIEHVGPSDPPPEKVEGHFAAERYWLTW